jgi:ribosomal protein S18 acetylase RimI-like enzyme
MADQPQVDVLSATDEERALATLTIAFMSDPIVRWAFRDANVYMSYFGPFTKAFGGAAFAQGTAHSIDDCGGVALWLPPGVGSDDETMGALAAEAIRPEDQETFGGFMGQIEEFHPKDPHWYLPMIGVDVTKQGLGYGSALLAYALERCDQDRLPAYLEATTSRSRALYERHGFEEIGVIQEGGSPPMWPMLRPPS